MPLPLVLILSLLFSVSVFADNFEVQSPPRVESSWVKKFPYVPQKNEYNFELGSMWETQNMYWIGASFGFHLGRCIYSQSHRCEQFADFIFGSGGRDGLTVGSLHSSLRWQYVDLEAQYVPFFRVMAGALNLRDNTRNKNEFSYGVGFGVVTAVHKRLDLRAELRVGQAEEVWSQAFIGFSVKFDEWVDYFAKKLESMGMAGQFIKGSAEFTGDVIKGTVKGAGTVLQKTGEATGKAVDSVSPKSQVEDD